MSANKIVSDQELIKKSANLMSQPFVGQEYCALADYILDCLRHKNKTIVFSEEDLIFLENACIGMIPMSVKINEKKGILYCPACERQVRKNYDLFCSGCGQNLSYSECEE